MLVSTVSVKVFLAVIDVRGNLLHVPIVVGLKWPDFNIKGWKLIWWCGVGDMICRKYESCLNCKETTSCCYMQ